MLLWFTWGGQPPTWLATLAHPASLGTLAGAVLLALLVDHLWGEPPARLHPVVWMGSALGAAARHFAPMEAHPRDYLSFWRFALIWFGLAAMVFMVSASLQAALLHGLPTWGQMLALGLLLKPLLAWRMLRSEVLAVEAALAQSLPAGRQRLTWLVSRNTHALSATAVRESAIETLAENLNDSVVAPLFWFVLLGLPGAACYRFANTADAMWGYPGWRDLSSSPATGQQPNPHNRRHWQWAGKWAARADDILSWLPARLTAALLLVVAGCWQWRHLRALRRIAPLTPSPNGGWPMGAMALALDVRLEKPGSYRLHPDGHAAQSGHLHQAVKYASKVIQTLAWLALIAMIFELFS